MDIDLWPDGRTSRHHARVWFESAQWWIEDLGSKHGTAVEGRPIEGRLRLDQWSEVQIGQTLLMLAPPDWLRLRGRGIVLDLEVAREVSFPLTHCGYTPLSHLVLRAEADRPRPSFLRIAFSGVGGINNLPLPPMKSGDNIDLPLPPFEFRPDLFEGQFERAQAAFSVEMDGAKLEGEAVYCSVLAHNEWTHAPQHRVSLAAFVLPNHPLVSQVASDACRNIAISEDKACIFEAVYNHLRSEWSLSYRQEPPSYGLGIQKIRLPHQLLENPASRVGQGTCLDIALLLAGCLEYLGLQAILAIVDVASELHALVGLWRKVRAGLNPIECDAARLAEGAIWADPNGTTLDSRFRCGFAASCTAALEHLEAGQLVFGLDIAAARRDGILPLPYAGEPRWSEPVERSICAAGKIAEAVPTRLGTVPLLLGLLACEEGITKSVFVHRFEDMNEAIQRLRQGLPRVRTATRTPSANYTHVLNIARSKAKVEGSPVVLEQHLISALLQISSTSIERALNGIGTSRSELLSILDGLKPLPIGGRASYSVLSEFAGTA